MPKAFMEENRDLCTPDDEPPDMRRLALAAPLRAAGALGTREDIEVELDDIANRMRGFALKAPDQVLREVAAFSARLTELCVLLHRVESYDRQYTRIRTQQVERFLAEMDRQFRVASRLIEVQRQDIAMLGAMT